jgi:ABC-2 type transport system ATP-binding protein
MMISFTNVTKRYGSLAAIDGVSIDIAAGEFLALLGPNGAGKSTFVKMLLDLVRPSAGTIAIDGRSSRDFRARGGVGYLAENHRIPPHLSGYAYLRRHADLCGLRGSAAHKEVMELIETVGMAGKERGASRTYSKGMGQRFGLAAALVGSPRLLVLDEPVTGLDPIGIRDVRVILERLNKRGVTILLNSHLLSEVEKTCGSAAIINKGKIVARGSIASLVKEGETLEDVFIRLVKSDARLESQNA